MKKKRNNHKKYRFTYIKVTASVLFLGLLFLKGYTPFEQTGENCFHIQVNGRDVGTLGDKSRIEELLQQARRNVASESDELVFMEVDMSVVGEEILWGETDREEEVLHKMEEALKDGVYETRQRAYTLKVNEYIINLASVDEVRQLLQAAVDKYGSDGKFKVELNYDKEREFSVLAAKVVTVSNMEDEGQQSYMKAGVENFLSGLTGESVQTENEDRDFEDFELGIRSMDFTETVEAVEAYLPQSQLTPLEEAINLVILEQEMPAIYKVEAGDTLSGIAIKLNIPMDRIVEMNGMEDINDIINVGDELLVTVPEPELSVTRVEQKFYEEIYDVEVEYIENPQWYTNHTETRQKPSAGLRRVVADVTYVNEKEVGREIIKEEVVQEAVAKVIERGTIVPPTYIKPVNGGLLTSRFGRRTAPAPGASTYHRAVDWAVPTGTTIYASCGGTVSRAGWGGGYGYVVYIDHEDGKQTRYAHCSRVTVKVGQKVNQGDKIAVSGSTGITSGPHLHFEMLVNGTQVDPLQYLE
ncbi:MAG: M23 family metallopeptidase [Lachnospiraceae bacterium]|nr:M23 family metallopeptidase [Lachnospiraceae bacterium]